mmetsp:Transcript_35776/g.55036  ORF Transcript_35776/g.55036 Transcript_35776/m.55036 type:complete len:171 (+) Transcript_35776:218-730(+)
MSMGFISPNRKTLLNELTTKKPIPKSVVLVPGGAKEALYAKPGTMKLALRKRKGFVRIALESGCSLVPCLGFGENEIYDTDGVSESSGLFALQKKLSFATPIVKHIIPRKTKLTVVVGNPIDCRMQMANPHHNQDVVDKFHERYLRELEELYRKYNPDYGNDNVSLQIIM